MKNNGKLSKVDATQIAVGHLPLLNAPITETRDIRKIALNKYRTFSVHFDSNVRLMVYANSLAELDRYLKRNHYSTGLVAADTNIPAFPQMVRGIGAWAAKANANYITYIVVYEITL